MVAEEADDGRNALGESDVDRDSNEMGSRQSPQHLSWADDYEDSECVNSSEIPLTPSTASDCQLRLPGSSPYGSGTRTEGPGRKGLRAGAVPFTPALVKALGAAPWVPRASPTGPVAARGTRRQAAALITAAAAAAAAVRDPKPPTSAPSAETAGVQTVQETSPVAKKLAPEGDRQKRLLLPAAFFPSLPRCAPFLAGEGYSGRQRPAASLPQSPATPVRPALEPTPAPPQPAQWPEYRPEGWHVQQQYGHHVSPVLQSPVEAGPAVWADVNREHHMHMHPAPPVHHHHHHMATGQWQPQMCGCSYEAAHAAGFASVPCAAHDGVQSV